MEIKYYRDLKHNYLVFKNNAPEDEEKNRYQYRMMESGRIRGLIPSSERNINGELFRYYEIGSMQPLRDRYAVGGMNCEQLKALLTDAAALLEELSEYLLGEEGLVFNARSVYTDLATGECRFLYCPFYDEPMDFADFAAELLDLVDLSDEKAAELAYLLCEKISEPGAFTLQTIKQLLSSESETDTDAGLRKAQSVQMQRSQRVIPDTAPGDDYLYDLEEDDEDEESPVKRKSAEGGGRLKLAERMMGGRLQLLFSLMFAAVVGAMMYIRMNFILTKEENLMSILVMLVSLITGAVSFVGGLRDFSGKRTIGKGAGTEEEEELYPEEEFEEFDDGFDDFEEFAGMTAAASKPLRITGNMNGQTTGSMSAPECGETIVLDQVKESDDLTLFSRNLDKTVRIGLEKLPLTIGKMEGCVDRVLGDSSVSRIHCRLQKEAGKLAIIDLGSTNGTFLNGIKLIPRQSTFIDEGDEIRIGRVCFDCR